MIEKKIYYIWMGDKEKPEIFHKCYNSWKKNLPEYDIIEINESNFNLSRYINENRFFRTCYEKKLWAYISDYVRVLHLYEHGGIYMDIDMEIIKNIDGLLKNKFFIGYEDEKNVSVGIFGTVKGHIFLKKVIEFYDNEIWEKPLWTIPKIFTYILERDFGMKDGSRYIENEDMKLYPKEYFYPYHFSETYTDECITENTYGIHWWNDSWNSIKVSMFMETKHLHGIKKGVKLIKIFLRYTLKKR